MNTYFNFKFNKMVVNIDMGEWFVSDQDVIIQTVLGSCISVCLFADGTNFAGMNHFMLPGKFSEHNIGMSQSGRYGMYAMEVLINELMKKGISKNHLKAKVFGGGNILNISHDNINIGRNNILFVKEYLGEEGIPIVSGDIGKDFARTILFFPVTKKVLMRKNDKSAAQRTAELELNYKKSLTAKKDEDNSQVILF